MAKMSLTTSVLERLSELGEGMLDAWFPKQYAHTRASRVLFGLDAPKKLTRQTISSLLWRLQRQGLVERSGSRRKSVWRLTVRGRIYCEKKKRKETRARMKKDGITRLVIFDIPESERRKRTMIRAELMSCNFRLLQKSVWIGEFPLPEDFITFADGLGLHGKLHVFSIREKGTIRETHDDKRG